MWINGLTSIGSRIYRTYTYIVLDFSVFAQNNVCIYMPLSSSCWIVPNIRSSWNCTWYVQRNTLNCCIDSPTSMNMFAPDSCFSEGFIWKPLRHRYVWMKQTCVASLYNCKKPSETKIERMLIMQGSPERNWLRPCFLAAFRTHLFRRPMVEPGIPRRTQL